MEKNLNFDNYKEKFCLLLHVEELQMQKDIRNYDMKGVVFQQERGDRRFLILEVEWILLLTLPVDSLSSQCYTFLVVEIKLLLRNPSLPVFTTNS